MDMRKVFEIEDLDCANCAAKMEEAVRKIDGVTYVNISFIAQRMTLEADDAIFDEVAKKAAKTCAKVDSDCRVILK
jgi:copper chaperone CopZ